MKTNRLILLTGLTITLAYAVAGIVVLYRGDISRLHYGLVLFVAVWHMFMYYVQTYRNMSR